MAWAADYYLRGWYANRDGYYPIGAGGGPVSFAPMYTYAQIVKGANAGTSLDQNLTIQEHQGVDTRADYYQGDYDYTDQPAATENLMAANYKIKSFTSVGGSSSFQSWVESTIASGNPIAVVLPDYPEFDIVGAGINYIVYPPTSGEKSRGNHGVFAMKYDANGLWIENQWSTNWGDKGYAELSWSFVNRYVLEAVSMVPYPRTQRFQEITSSLVYVLDGAGNLWRETPNSSNKTQVDGNVAAFQAMDYNTVYVLGTDGTLWREYGNYTNRNLVDWNI